VTIIAVSGLMREARIAAGPGIRTLVGGGNAQLLRGKLEHAIAEGAQGLISIGIAGGLAGSLKTGECIVASEVRDGDACFPADAAWAARIREKLPNAIFAAIAGTDTIAATKLDKATLFRQTGAYAVDMESHIVARAAKTHGLAFAALRTICDSADTALPPLASAAITARGTLALGGVLISLVRDPRQISVLPRMARDSRTAFAALLRCRRRLGLRLLGPDDRKPALDMT
jgi:hopanoid-associated phosphorylase